MPRKVFVSVLLAVDAEGNVQPRRIRYEDNEVYIIDRVRSRRRAVSHAGGYGTRYAVVVNGTETFLFEENGRWFVEGKN